VETEPKTTDRDTLLAEYEAIVNMHMHYDNINMGMLALVTAGVFVLWSTILQKSITTSLMIAVHWSTFLVLSIWIRYLSVHRRIIVIKLSRSHEIEAELGMDQNTRFRFENRMTWPRKRPGGHSLELSLYMALTLFGVFVALASALPASTTGVPGRLLTLGAILPVLIAVWWSANCRVDVLQHIHGYDPPHYLQPFLHLGGWKRRAPL